MCKWIELVFGVMVNTEDSYFLLDGVLDLFAEREMSTRDVIWTVKISLSEACYSSSC